MWSTGRLGGGCESEPDVWWRSAHDTECDSGRVSPRLSWSVRVFGGAIRACAKECAPDEFIICVTVGGEVWRGAAAYRLSTSHFSLSPLNPLLPPPNASRSRVVFYTLTFQNRIESTLLKLCNDRYSIIVVICNKKNEMKIIKTHDNITSSRFKFYNIIL